MNQVVVGVVTCGSLREARRIARALVEQRLAACVNISAPVESHYRWEGRLESARECMLIIKTLARRRKDVERAVRALHSYQVPEVIFWKVAGGAVDYLGWVRESVS